MTALGCSPDHLARRAGFGPSAATAMTTELRMVSIDFETTSDVDLKKAGLYRYASDPTTYIICMSWAMPGADPVLWQPGDPFPFFLEDWITSGCTLSGWNSPFEREVWREIGVVQFGFPRVRDHQWVNSQAHAVSRNLPGSLDGTAGALALPVRKDAAGSKLMKKLAIRRNFIKATPDEIRRLHEYNKQDVVVEQAIISRLSPLVLPAKEQSIYDLSEKINRRGVKIDLPLVQLAAREVAAFQHHVAEQMQRTFGVEPSQVARILQRCEDFGVVLPDLMADTVDSVLSAADFYPDEVVQLLRFRQQSAAVAPKKFAAMLRAVCFDDRIRGMFRYCGAGQTGRWSGMLVQFHNLMRPTMPLEEALTLLDTFMCEQTWRALGDDPLNVFGNFIRLSLIPDGGVFTAGDESAIEARVLPWLAGDEKTLDVFRNGGDVYLHSASGIYHREITKADKEERQIGKVATLALGFGGGKNAFGTMARNYGVTVAPEEADKIKTRWRAAHPEIVTLWAVLDSLALEAVASEQGNVPPSAYRVADSVIDLGRVVHVRARLKSIGVRFAMKSGTLWCRLPSGRALAWHGARAEYKVASPLKKIFLEQGYDEEEATRRAMRWRVAFVSPKGDSMVRDGTYGGKLSENLTQAVARDVLAEAMLRLEREPLVLHVHDEIVAEGPDITDKMEDALTTQPDWAPDLPLAAEVSTLERYWK